MFIDAAIVTMAPCLAIMARFDGIAESQYFQNMVTYLPVIIFIRLITFYGFGLYHRLWRYASVNELFAIVGAVTVSSMILLIYFSAINFSSPRSIHLLTWFFNIVLVGASRLFIRLLHHYLRRNSNQARTKVLIVGAGDAGAMIAREINQRYYATKELVGFVDDDRYKHNKMLFGAKVLGSMEDIGTLALRYAVSEIIVAIPSVSGKILRDIIRECQQTKCSVKTVPGLYEMIDGKVTVQQLRNVELEDLLRREPVQLDTTQIAKYLMNKRVLVTGAGGSIGSELCRQIARMSPATLYLLGKGENSIYEIDRELGEKYPNLAIEPIIADVRDRERIHAIFERARPQVIFHAAAHKHVPLMEREPEEAIRNNVFGTQVVAEAADRHNAEIFIMISTDKAVNPTSVMGATKRVAEMIVQNLSSVSSTKFAAVRFGNVLGSRGSVVPLFKRQIAAGGPVTITHPEMRRYFMTIPEATQLVLQAGTMAKGGEVFVLDMGEPIRILDMACDLVELSGLVPYKDIAIEFTGIRPGEKLFEELLTTEEGTASTKHAKIFRANLRPVNEAALQEGLSLLRQPKQRLDVIKALVNLVPTYHKVSNPIESNLNRNTVIGRAENDQVERITPVPVSLH
jgi:FlaA1/EpsC-like NDP-sugar epimerase